MENLDCYELLNVKEDDTLIVIFNKCEIYTLSKYKSENKILLNSFFQICNEDRRKDDSKEFLLHLQYKNYNNFREEIEDIIKRINYYND